MIEEYSEVLFRKLEKKVADLERETALRKEAETETLRHCMTLDTVIENAAGPICSVDDSYRYTSFNKAHALYMKFKYGVDIEPGKNIVDYVGDKEDTEGLVDGIKKALVGETTVAEYSTLIEGHERFFEVTYGPIKAKGGPFVGVVVSGYDITDRKMAEDRLAHNYSELEEALHGLVNALAATVKTRDPYTALHQKNVSQLAEAIALKMGLSEDKARSLGLAGLVHDVGKIHVPGEVLNKPGVLSQTEYELVKTHPEAAFAILKDIKFKDDVAVMIRQHHERLDGSGYPEGITGKDMLLGSKIMAVADVVAAMTSPRPYRAAFKIEDALKEIRDNRENLYDPTVVDACVELFEEDGFVFSESEY
jgi:putative nucleotidyltransferase with HDIG domain/PAS domain S-box-containing protein